MTPGRADDVGGSDFTAIHDGLMPKDSYCPSKNIPSLQPDHDMWPTETINGRFGRGAASTLRVSRS